MKINFATIYDKQSREVRRVLTNKDFEEIRNLIGFKKRLTKARNDGKIKI